MSFLPPKPGSKSTEEKPSPFKVALSLFLVSLVAGKVKGSLEHKGPPPKPTPPDFVETLLTVALAKATLERAHESFLRENLASLVAAPAAAALLVAATAALVKAQKEGDVPEDTIPKVVISLLVASLVFKELKDIKDATAPPTPKVDLKLAIAVAAALHVTDEFVHLVPQLIEAAIKTYFLTRALELVLPKK
ncbi:hypothetical protein RFI_05810 [Reticulomyxa filosa]|uniref:Uncharacterized protein n=1 Tax=Reticulomyxa filosa TaxID=46433 RepID=X6NZB5_RETFI|nr:hypothetical protein RFI_05810 [Reticulomyxa filosa]|eukprot:ETO31306.1 hypothetical protein RFI_05810 [Reticulomyxa filosa]